MLRVATSLFFAAATIAPFPLQISEVELASRRRAMVADQIEARDVRDRRVLDAMRTVPRHRFVPPALIARAYDDTPLPIGYGQTISQPYIVAYMTEALGVERRHKVLEIGAGSGYQAAVLGELAGSVYTIEIVPELAQRATATTSAQAMDSAGGRSRRRSIESWSRPRRKRFHSRCSTSSHRRAGW